MKIKFLKNHNSHLTGDTLEVADAAGNYLVLCKVAEKVKTASKTSTEKEEVKTEAVKEPEVPATPVAEQPKTVLSDTVENAIEKPADNLAGEKLELKEDDDDSYLS